MGFFASRWIEKHGAASEKAALNTITSSGFSGPFTSGSEGAGTVKSKWVSLIVTVSLTLDSVLDVNVKGHPAGGSAREPEGA